MPHLYVTPHPVAPTQSPTPPHLTFHSFTPLTPPSSSPSHSPPKPSHLSLFHPPQPSFPPSRMQMQTVHRLTKLNCLQKVVIGQQGTTRNKDVLVKTASFCHVYKERRRQLHSTKLINYIFVTSLFCSKVNSSLTVRINSHLASWMFRIPVKVLNRENLTSDDIFSRYKLANLVTKR